MPSIGWSEMLMLAVVAIVVVGPKELPRLMRVAGHWMGKAKAAAREFQQAFDEMARESDLEEMRRKMADVHRQYMTDLYENGEPAASEQDRTPDGNGAGTVPAESTSDRSGQSAGERTAERPEEPGEPKQPEKSPVPSH